MTLSLPCARCNHLRRSLLLARVASGAVIGSRACDQCGARLVPISFKTTGAAEAEIAPTPCPCPARGPDSDTVVASSAFLW